MARRGKDIGDGGERGGGDHADGVVALRILDFLGDGRSVVPAHVIPHGNQERRGERRFGAG